MHREIECVGEVIFMRGHDRNAVFVVVHLPDGKEQLTARYVQLPRHCDVGSDRSEAGDAVVDGDPEVAFQDVVHGTLQHLVRQLGMVRQKAGREDVPREDDGFAIGRPDALHDEDVLRSIYGENLLVLSRGQLAIGDQAR